MMSSRSVGLLILFVAVAAAGAIYFGRQALLPPPAADPAALALEELANREEARAAFRNPEPATPEQTAEFSPVLLKLGRAIKSGRADAIRDCFNLDRFTAECGRAGVFEKLGLAGNPVAFQQFKTGMRIGLGQALAQKKDFFVWEALDVRRVRLSEDGTEAIVIATHHLTDAAGDTTADPIRWWLTRQSGEWQVYDFEELALGLRMTSLMSAVASPDMLRNIDQFRAATGSMNAVFQAVAQQDFDAADQALGPMRQARPILPRPFLGVLAVMEASIAAGRGKAETCHRFLDEAAGHNPDMPITHMLRAAAYNLQGQYAEAIAAATKYVDLLGPDASVLQQRALAQEHLERGEEAAASYRLALDFEPNNLDCLSGLRRVLGSDGTAEAVARLKKRTLTTADQLRALADDEDDEDDPDPDWLDAVAELMRKDDDTRADGLYHAARAAVLRKQPAAAVKVLAEAFKMDGDGRAAAVNRIVNSLGWAGHALPAYAATPAADRDHVFRSLAGIEVDRLGEADKKETPKRRAEVDRLLAAHRKNSPKDPWIPFYVGEAEAADGHDDKAEAAYRQALTGITADDDRDRVRLRLVHTLHRLGRGHEAYTTYGQTPGVFDALAAHFDADKDAAGLKKLLDLHRAKAAADPLLTYWTGSYHWSRGEYAAAVKEYRAYRQATKEMPKGTVRYGWLADGRVVRGLVRLKQFADARGELKKLAAGHDYCLDPLVPAALGDVDGTLEAVARVADGKEYVLRALYADEDLGPLLRSDRMKPVRERHPEPPPAPNGKPEA